MLTYRSKRLGQVLLLTAVLALALIFTAVAQAGGPGQPLPPAGGPHAPGGPPSPKPPPSPDLANCIDVFAWYDGNFDGRLDGNEDLMDGASIRLMKSYPAPSTAPPIGPDGRPMGMPAASMGPHAGPLAPTSGPMPTHPPYDGPMPGMPMKNEGFAKFVVVDHKLTRDGGVTQFCGLQPGDYILQGDAPDGITYGDNRQFVTLGSGGYQLVSFAFTSLDMTPAVLNGDGA